MSELIMVEGQACLDYIDKPIGLVRHSAGQGFAIQDLKYANLAVGADGHASGTVPRAIDATFNTILTSTIKWKHNTSNRIVGYVSQFSDDGGLEVTILGNDKIELSNGDLNNCDYNITRVSYGCIVKYDKEELTTKLNKPSIPVTPLYVEDVLAPYVNQPKCTVSQFNYEYVPFDDSIDFVPEFRRLLSNASLFSDVFSEYAGESIGAVSRINITDDPSNTLKMGVVHLATDSPNIALAMAVDPIFINPVGLMAGNLYNYLTSVSMRSIELCPDSFDSDTYIDDFYKVTGLPCVTVNMSNLPCNMILTRNLQYALNYLDNGTLPPDAFLYPLDWDNLPRYDDPVPTPDKPEDYPDDNDPDDDLRDFDPTPNETPTFTVNQLTNYNWYWLTVPQWADFISWFWNDIGNFSDFDDIIAKVKGLYNDVASAVIMCRYYPVDISWIGGLGTQSNIKLGMIEKAGAVDTISQANALRSVDIGHVHIGQKYKSFMDMSPYSQLSLYLPWHGFIDLDMNLFNGHDVYVKALYDYLSGTIQYYIFYDNEVLVNTILCKMAMDIPITLQTKNDRDSAIFNNVSSTIGGLVGAGAGILSGNPIGMALGVTQGVGAFNSANASAPMRLMGNVGESGAYIGCQNCFVVVRRPTIQPSDGNAQTSTKGLTTWKKNVGMLCGYGYKLSSLSGKGFTVCHSPRIDFTNTAPLQSEVDEIYNYLEKGVIL